MSPVSRQMFNDLAMSDHHPVCPRCGDVLEPGAKWCGRCGCWVLLDAPRSSDLRSRAVSVAAQLEREAPAPAEGTEA